MKLGSSAVRRLDTIAVHGWVPVHLEDCKACKRITQETIFAYLKDRAVGTFETDRSGTSGSRKWYGKFLPSQVYLWRTEELAYRDVLGAGR